MDWPISPSGLDAGEAWARGVADALWGDVLWWGVLGFALAFATLLLLGALAVTCIVRRRFWCDTAGREVEVSFIEGGLPGLRRPVAVQSCSVFDPPTAVRCHRACLDQDARARWPMTSRLEGRER